MANSKKPKMIRIEYLDQWHRKQAIEISVKDSVGFYQQARKNGYEINSVKGI